MRKNRLPLPPQMWGLGLGGNSILVVFFDKG